jgi:hypothetical protein
MTIRYLALFAPLMLGGCYGVAGHDEMDRYIQRSDTITMSAGNAKEVNAATHTVNPWPRYVGDRRLAYDARRVGSAVTRYGTQKQPVDQLPNFGAPTEQMGQRPPVQTDYNITGLGAGATGGVAVPVGGGANR